LAGGQQPDLRPCWATTTCHQAGAPGGNFRVMATRDTARATPTSRTAQTSMPNGATEL
jgi:hypothetical protein